MNTSKFVTLRGGLTVPLAALQLALDLEGREIHLALDGDGLSAGPRERLTDADRSEIRRWKLHLRAIVASYADAHQGRQ